MDSVHDSWGEDSVCKQVNCLLGERESGHSDEDNYDAIELSQVPRPEQTTPATTML
jgi:hypothetical protein